MAGPGRKFTPEEREEVLARVDDMVSMGYRQYEIAKEIGVSQPQVSLYLAEVRARRGEYKLQQKEANIADKLAELRLIRVEAWKEWKRSKAPFEIYKEVDENRTSQTSSVTISRSVREVHHRLGAPALLQLVKDCLDSEMELLGMKSKDTGVQVNIISWDTIVTGQLTREATIDTVENEILKVENMVKSSDVSNNGTNGEVHE